MTGSDHAESMRVNVGTARSWRMAGLTVSQFRLGVQGGDLARVRRGVYTTRAFMNKAKEKAALWQVLQVASAMSRQSAPEGGARHQTAALIHGISLLHAADPGIVCLTRPPGRYRGGGLP